MKNFCLWAISFSSLLAASSAVHGQAFPMFDNVAAGLSISAGNAILSQNTLRESARAKGIQLRDDKVFDHSVHGKSSSSATEKSAHASTRIPKPADGRGIEVLISGYPDAQKPQMRELFRKMIDMFEPVAQKLGVPAHDIGSAAAALIAGSYAAYHDQVLPDEYFKPLAQQMQDVFARDPGFAKLSSAEKQRMYQIMVGTGMFFTIMQLENAKQPDPKVALQLRTAGADFLEKFTRLDPAVMRIDRNGLSIP